MSPLLIPDTTISCKIVGTVPRSARLVAAAEAAAVYASRGREFGRRGLPWSEIKDIHREGVIQCFDEEPFIYIPLAAMNDSLTLLGHANVL